MTAPQNILVATDFGPVAEAALKYGRTLAQTFGARLHVLHAMENPFLRPSAADPHDHTAGVLRTLNEQVSDDDRTTLKAQVVLETSDNPAASITSYAKSANIDLIVMGTNSRGALAHLLVGSVAERVVRTAHCPVLIIKHPEQQFVVADEPQVAKARA